MSINNIINLSRENKSFFFYSFIIIKSLLKNNIKKKLIYFISISLNVISILKLNFQQVAWIHIDRQMILTIHRHVIARIPRFGITHDSQKTWLLHVKGAQPEDRGYYMCQVNTNPMISQVGYLQVVGEFIFSTKISLS